MKAISKQELIERIQKQLPDDAMIIGNSSMGGEFFELLSLDEDGYGDVFFEITDDVREDMGDELPEGVTHVLEVC